MHARGDDPPIFKIGDDQLKNVEAFMYLGSTLNRRGTIDDDVQRRLGLASVSFGKLSGRVFLSRDLKLSTKIAVYKAVCLSVLLYAGETWVPYRKHIKLLEKFHIRCLQTMLGIRWWHRVPRRRAGINSLESILTQRQLRWAGHVIRMPDNRLPRRVMYSELTLGCRGVGAPQKRYKDRLKHCLRACDIPPEQLEARAEDRYEWRRTSSRTAAIFNDKYDELANERQDRRNRPQDPANLVHICDVCDRACAPRIGLISHRRTH